MTTTHNMQTTNTHTQVVVAVTWHQYNSDNSRNNYNKNNQQHLQQTATKTTSNNYTYYENNKWCTSTLAAAAVTTTTTATSSVSTKDHYPLLRLPMCVHGAVGCSHNCSRVGSSIKGPWPRSNSLMQFLYI